LNWAQIVQTTIHPEELNPIIPDSGIQGISNFQAGAPLSDSSRSPSGVNDDDKGGPRLKI